MKAIQKKLITCVRWKKSCENTKPNLPNRKKNLLRNRTTENTIRLIIQFYTDNRQTASIEKTTNRETANTETRKLL